MGSREVGFGIKGFLFDIEIFTFYIAYLIKTHLIKCVLYSTYNAKC